MKMSVPGSSAATASIIGSAVSTSTRSTPGGVATFTGPATSTTRAPARRAASATAKPILPELRLVMNRTGSMRSRVGPAVTTTLRPASAPVPGSSRKTASTIASGSSIRPGPVSPQACPPAAGPRISTPRERSRSTLARVAAFDHISRFMAGATAIGASVARHRVASRSSASPCARRAMKSALAGATTMRSAQRASSM